MTDLPQRQHNEVDGKRIGDEIIATVATAVAQLKSTGWSPKLVAIMVGSSPAIDLYVRNQRAAAGRVGVDYEVRAFPSETTEQEVLGAITAMNADPRVTGLIIQRPVPPGINIRVLQSAVHPLKDVEGLHPASIGNIVYNELDLAPCTASAAVEILRRTGLTLEGLEVVVVGHSEIVGKPIAFLLMAEGATVTVCHNMTRSVAMHSRRADAVFVAVGQPRLITADMIKPGAALIDIGINRIPGPDGRMITVGDVDYASCQPVAGWITPVPGGVGPVTIATLMRNTLVAAQRQKSHYESAFAATDTLPPRRA